METQLDLFTNIPEKKAKRKLWLLHAIANSPNPCASMTISVEEAQMMLESFKQVGINIDALVDDAK